MTSVPDGSGRGGPAEVRTRGVAITMWWDLAMYLNHAEFRIEDRSYREVGFAEFHIAAHGGFDLSKYRSTDSKVAPVLDRLLSGASP